MVFTGKNVTAFQKIFSRLAVEGKACGARRIVQKLQLTTARNERKKTVVSMTQRN